MATQKEDKQTVNFKVAGVSFRQESLKKLALGGYKNRIKLEREPDNEYDSNAIKVFGFTTEGEELFIGYVPKDIAAQIQRCSKGVVHKVTIYGGGEDKNYGCAIDIDFFGVPNSIEVPQDAPTDKQLKFIESIEKQTGKKFTGTTKKEASDWITENKQN